MAYLSKSALYSALQQFNFKMTNEVRNLLQRNSTTRSSDVAVVSQTLEENINKLASFAYPCHIRSTHFSDGDPSHAPNQANNDKVNVCRCM